MTMSVGSYQGGHRQTMLRIQWTCDFILTILVQLIFTASIRERDDWARPESDFVPFLRIYQQPMIK